MRYLPMQNDIRNWLSPKSMHAPQLQQPIRQTPTQTRRRRIIESDDSDNERQIQSQVPQENAAQPQHAAPPALPAATTETVLLNSSESDDLYVPLPRSTCQIESSTPHHSDHEALPIFANKRRNTIRAVRGRRSRRRYEEQAEEASDIEDASSECAENDTDARQQYHEAIMGVRNAKIARAQLHSKTVPCPVCALFASFMQHFY